MDWEPDYDNEALQFLVDHELDGAARGITRRVIATGRQSLSPKQQAVFESYVVAPWLSQRCRCGNHSVESFELIGLWGNNGYCARCANRMDKDLRRDGVRL